MRVGAAYRLAAIARTGCESDAAQAIDALSSILRRAALSRPGSSGQHGQHECALRASQYGLAAAGARAAPALLHMLEEATAVRSPTAMMDASCISSCLLTLVSSD